MAVRRDLEPVVRRLAASFPAVTITGPRQSGKSTLSRDVFADLPYANLEAPDTRAFAAEDPRSFLTPFPTGAVLDEIQRVPQLLSYLQPIIDDDPQPGQWVLTGSQNLTLLDSVSQSLAGRTALLELLPLTRAEVVRFARYPTSLDEALLTGGYPRILDQRLDPADWLAAYVATYVERDVRSVSNIGDLVTYQRMLDLAAGRTLLGAREPGGGHPAVTTPTRRSPPRHRVGGHRRARRVRHVRPPLRRNLQLSWALRSVTNVRKMAEPSATSAATMVTARAGHHERRTS